MAPHDVLNRNQLVVLGMHRSGTSLLTRTLHLMGASFGASPELLPPNSNNPEGFWERGDVCALNDHLLQSAGAAWFRVLPYAKDRLPDALLEDAHVNIGRIVALMNRERPWVMKDPRLCLTFPLWRPHLDAPVVLLAVRDPAAVAQSLRKRDGFPTAAGLALWEFYTLAALRASAGLPRLAIPVEPFVNDPVAAARQLLQQLAAAGVTGLREPAPDSLADFIKPAQFQPASGAAHLEGLANACQIRLYESLLDGAALARADTPALSPGGSAALEELAADHAAREEAARILGNEQRLGQIARAVGVMERSTLLRGTHALQRWIQILRRSSEPIPFDHLHALLQPPPN